MTLQLVSECRMLKLGSVLIFYGPTGERLLSATTMDYDRFGSGLQYVGGLINPHHRYWEVHLGI